MARISRSLSTRERVLVAITAALLFVWLVGWVVYAPLREDLKITEASVVELEQTLTRYRSLVSQEDAIIAQYKAYQAQEKGVGPPVSATDLIEQIQDLSAGLLDYTSIRPIETGHAASESAPLAVEFHCAADIEQVIGLLYRIEKESHGLSVKNLTFSASGDTPGQTVAHALVDVSRP